MSASAATNWTTSRLVVGRKHEMMTSDGRVRRGGQEKRVVDSQPDGCDNITTTATDTFESVNYHAAAHALVSDV